MEISSGEKVTIDIEEEVGDAVCSIPSESKRASVCPTRQMSCQFDPPYKLASKVLALFLYVLAASMLTWDFLFEFPLKI